MPVCRLSNLNVRDILHSCVLRIRIFRKLRDLLPRILKLNRSNDLIILVWLDAVQVYILLALGKISYISVRSSHLNHIIGSQGQAGDSCDTFLIRYHHKADRSAGIGKLAAFQLFLGRNLALYLIAIGIIELFDFFLSRVCVKLGSDISAYVQKRSLLYLDVIHLLQHAVISRIRICFQDQGAVVKQLAGNLIRVINLPVRRQNILCVRQAHDLVHGVQNAILILFGSCGNLALFQDIDLALARHHEYRYHLQLLCVVHVEMDGRPFSCRRYQNVYNVFRFLLCIGGLIAFLQQQLPIVAFRILELHQRILGLDLQAAQDYIVVRLCRPALDLARFCVNGLDLIVTVVNECHRISFRILYSEDCSGELYFRIVIHQVDLNRCQDIGYFQVNLNDFPCILPV